MRFKFLTAVIALILAIVLQLFLGEVLGVWTNIVLASLVTAAFFLNFLELLFLILLAVFVLNWQPAPSLEMALYAALPISTLLMHKFFPFKSWLGNLVAIFLALLIFYLAVGPRFLITSPVVFLWDLAIGLVLGSIFFKISNPHT